MTDAGDDDFNIEQGIAELEAYRAILNPHQLVTHPEIRSYVVCDEAGIPRFADGSTYMTDKWRPTEWYVIDADTRHRAAVLLAKKHPDLAQKLGWRAADTTDSVEFPTELADMFVKAYESGLYDSDDPASKHARRLAEHLQRSGPEERDTDVQH